MLVAYHGMPRAAFVEPSSGSSTASSGGEPGGRLGQARLLAQHRAARPGQDADGNLVGDEIRSVLTGAGTGRPPVLECLECGRDGARRLSHHLDQRRGLH